MGEALEEFKKIFDAMKPALTRSYWRRREEEMMQRIEELKADIGVRQSRINELEAQLKAVSNGN